MSRWTKREISGMIGQWVGMIAVICGIFIEISMGADIGYIAITAGSLVYAVATKLLKF